MAGAARSVVIGVDGPPAGVMTPAREQGGPAKRGAVYIGRGVYPDAPEVTVASAITDSVRDKVPQRSVEGDDIDLAGGVDAERVDVQCR